MERRTGDRGGAQAATLGPSDVKALRPQDHGLREVDPGAADHRRGGPRETRPSSQPPVTRSQYYRASLFDGAGSPRRTWPTTTACAAATGHVSADLEDDRPTRGGAALKRQRSGRWCWRRKMSYRTSANEMVRRWMETAVRRT
jgi:hypothetical protein